VTAKEAIYAAVFYSGGYPLVMLEFTLAIIEGVVWGWAYV